jgi:hypothetical protein
MTPTKRDIPPWTALTVVALALIATIVSGREPTAPQPAGERAAAETSRADPGAGDLRLALRLEDSGDLLAPVGAPLPSHVVLGKAHVAAPPEAPPPARAARAPTARGAPPLPFTYLAKLIDGDKTTVFVAHGEDHYSAEPGLTVDDAYRIERVTDTAITFLHLPTRTRQVLAVVERP